MKSLILILTLATAGQCGVLTHQYIFQGDANDQIGSANGTLVNGATALGGVLSLTAASQQYVQFASQIIPATGSYSVAFFAQQLTTGTTVELISQGAASGFFIHVLPTGDVQFGGNVVSVPHDQMFHHYAVVEDSVANTSQLYIDGVLRSTLNFAIVTSGAANTRLGRQFDPTGDYLNGAEKDVRIYSGALTAQDVAMLAGVPEPATSCLIGAGVLCLVILRRRL